MTFDEWITAGINNGWCGPPCCVPHDGIGTTETEDTEYDDGGDPCYHAIRLYPNPQTKADVETNHPPSKWRNLWTDHK
jgi:hypothetical protein